MASVAVQIIVCVALLASMTPSVQADNRRYDKNREYYRDGLALPIWAIVLITVASVVLLLIFCFCCCAMCQLNEEDKKRGYQNRRHSPKEFIVVMLPGRRDQIYADYESRQQRRTHINVLPPDINVTQPLSMPTSKVSKVSFHNVHGSSEALIPRTEALPIAAPEASLPQTASAQPEIETTATLQPTKPPLPAPPPPYTLLPTTESIGNNSANSTATTVPKETLPPPPYTSLPTTESTAATVPTATTILTATTIPTAETIPTASVPSASVPIAIIPETIETTTETTTAPTALPTAVPAEIQPNIQPSLVVEGRGQNPILIFVEDQNNNKIEEKFDSNEPVKDANLKSSDRQNNNNNTTMEESNPQIAEQEMPSLQSEDGPKTERQKQKLQDTEPQKSAESINYSCNDDDTEGAVCNSESVLQQLADVGGCWKRLHEAVSNLEESFEQKNSSLHIIEKESESIRPEDVVIDEIVEDAVVNGAPSENENEFLDEKVIAILNGRVILDEVDILDEDVNLEMST